MRAIRCPPVIFRVGTAYFRATAGASLVYFSWSEVEGATKYTVEVDATVTFVIGGQPAETSVGLVYGTADRTDGGVAAASYLVVRKSALVEDVMAALAAQGVEVDQIHGLTINALAKVKALNPGKGSGRQNNSFSNSSAFRVVWVAP